MRHRSRGQRVHEDARDALQVGDAAQADAQTDASLWRRNRGVTHTVPTHPGTQPARPQDTYAPVSSRGPGERGSTREGGCPGLLAAGREGAGNVRGHSRMATSALRGQNTG